ncbi:MAG: hypothetical protein RR255_00170 [Bacilli bacterium]
MKDELYSWNKYDRQFKSIGDRLNYEKYDERDSEYDYNDCEETEEDY